MQPVSQSTVVRSWLRQERDGQATGDDTAELDDAGALDRLLRLKPGAAAFVWRDAPVDWFRLELTRDEFLDLHVVPGPEGLGWRALSPDDTIAGAAERIDREDAEPLTQTTGIDVPKILTLRDELPVSADVSLVLSTRRGCVPWSVADGNHRAVATALTLLEGGQYEPQRAYLGVGANPVVGPVRSRLCGVVRRLRHRFPRRPVRP